MLKDFRSRVVLRILFLALSIGLIMFMAGRANMFFATLLTAVVLMLQLAELFHFVNNTNRKLTRFLESIKYSDFITGFAADDKLGASFRGLNVAFNDVLEAFRKTRSEKEEHWQYLNTVVQQVRTGILSFDTAGEVQLINSNARRILGVTAMQNLSALREFNPPLYTLLLNLKPGKSELYRKDAEHQVVVQATDLRIRGQEIKLVTLQNIQSELQQQELEAWQNLTRVLRHEIMNSITPISSLTSTLREVLANDLVARNGVFELSGEAANDLREGLDTIEGRSKGLIKFIDAYREYTSLPKPVLKTVHLKSLLDRVAQLMAPQLAAQQVRFSCRCESDYLTLQADEEMIEQVLINLIKNASESVAQRPNAKIELNGRFTDQAISIEVVDNGAGIIQEALSRIFIPFFTTKKNGSGIGLSLSRQIMHLHKGTLTAESIPDVETKFTLKF
jgi:nitrogen fixation/metabolism regulation signal transduction histidine kinase